MYHSRKESPAAFEALLHVLLVSFDHLLDHLAADGAGFAGGEVAVVAIGQVNADLLGGLHLELVHGLTGLGDVELVVIVVAHNGSLLFNISGKRMLSGWSASVFFPLPRKEPWLSSQNPKQKRSKGRENSGSPLVFGTVCTPVFYFVKKWGKIPKMVDKSRAIA